MRKAHLFLLLSCCLILSVFVSCEQSKQPHYDTLEELASAKSIKFAMADANAFHEEKIVKEIPNVEFIHYTNYFDTFQEVMNGKVDIAFCFADTLSGLRQNFPSFKTILSEIKIPIVFAYSANRNDLKNEFNEFISSPDFPAFLEQQKAIWLDETTQDKGFVPYEDLTGENGSFTLAFSNTNYPLEYYQGNNHAGLEHAIVYEFAKTHGYAVNLVETAYEAAVAGVGTGKYDMSIGFYGQSEERSDTGNFSIPYMYDNFCYIAREDSATPSVGFLESLKLRFERNFIRESRWKLIVNGLLATLEITLVSVCCGSVLGFGLFLVCQKYRKLEKVCLSIHENLEALPVIVILLVFFYVFFSKSRLSGFMVSQIVFTLLFLFTFLRLLSGSVNGIEKGQSEGALALGYTPFQTLIKVILPQAMDSFLPAYQSAIIATLKGTAIVGYVAVQDLTKAGDIIRSLTFDALFPIVGIAIVYYLIAKILIFLMSRLFVIDRKKNTKKYLREVAQ